MLEEILKYKREEVKKRKAKKRSFDNLCSSTKNFKKAITGKEKLSVIAELKKASPTKGTIDAEFDYITIAKEYERAEVSCVSVLTDEKFFQGSLEVMKDVAEAVSMPVLRKDFIIDPYQVYEARANGADAILLIVKALDDLSEFQNIAENLGMDVLVEVHNKEELNRALELDESNLIIGINNRNLNDLTIDMRNVPILHRKIPQEYTVVAESGYKSQEDIAKINGKVDGVLVGTSIMQAADKLKTIQSIFSPILA